MISLMSYARLLPAKRGRLVPCDKLTVLAIQV